MHMCIETEAQCTLRDENSGESTCKCLTLRLVQSTSRGGYSDVMYGGEGDECQAPTSTSCVVLLFIKYGYT